MRAIIFEAMRTSYSIDQEVDRAMTVGELMDLLEGSDPEDLIIMSHDNGYTYGSIFYDREEEIED